MDLSCYNSSDGISLSSLSGEENEKSAVMRESAVRREHSRSRSRSRSKSTHKHKKKHKRHSHKHKHKHKSSSRKEKKHKKRSKHKRSKEESGSETSASEEDLELVDQLLESTLDHGKIKDSPKDTKEKFGGRDIEIRHLGAGNGAVASMKISVSNTLSDILNANGMKSEFNTMVVGSSSEEEDQMDSTENSREAQEINKRYDEFSMDSSEFLNIDEDNVGLEELIKQKAALQACLGAYMSDDDDEDEEEEEEEEEEEDDDEREEDEKEKDVDDDVVEMMRVESSRYKVDRKRKDDGLADKRKNGTQITDVVTIDDSDEEEIKKKDKDKERRKDREKAKKRKRSRVLATGGA